MTNIQNDTFELLTGLMEEHTGQHLMPSRHWRIEIALKRVMRIHSIPDLAMLASLLASDADQKLARDCVEAMINNETCFFRDQANFALMTGPAIDAMREKRRPLKKLRIWSAACSTGQEAYSLAISFAENAEKWRGWDISILATDVSRSALKKAKSARYSQFEIQRGLPVTMMLKHFRQEREDWVLNEDIRKLVTFTEHNQTKPAAHFGKFDLILCRNMLMYLSNVNKALVLENLRSSIAADGYLMLGAAETVIGHTESFNTSGEFRGLYEASGDKRDTSQYRISA
ncbi:MAG: protein-glutamate O-methyltransferase CheR [Sphingorhabdus sp.]